MESRLLRVFISYAHEDVQNVQRLYRHLINNGVDAWLDSEKLLGGQNWSVEIEKQVQISDVILICLSKRSVSKEGYVQKEIKFALDKSDEKPEGTIYIIPVKLDDCNVPSRLSKYHWVELYEPLITAGYQKIADALNERAKEVGANFLNRSALKSIKNDGKNFGKIVESLRLDLGISQTDLAKLANLEGGLVYKIESGDQRIFDINILNSLSIALGLTNLEKREFLSAVSDISDNNTNRTINKVDLSFFDVNETIRRIANLIQILRVPAFVTDVYSDIIFSNLMVIDFLDVGEELVVGAEGLTGGYNMMRMLFHPLSTYRYLVGDDWERHALLNIRFFRRMSLRHRSTEYFSKLMEELKQYDEFRNFYNRALSQVSDEFTSYAVYTIDSKRHGKCKYTGTEVFLMNTPCGEIYLHLYLPLDKKTEETFSKIYSYWYKRFGEMYMPFAPFPDKQKCDIGLITG